MTISFRTTSPCCVGNEIDLKQELTLSDDTVRFLCPELTEEGLWHHLVLTLHRAGIMKNSSVGLFVDGQHMETQKVSSFLYSFWSVVVKSMSSVGWLLGIVPLRIPPLFAQWLSDQLKTFDTLVNQYLYYC